MSKSKVYMEEEDCTIFDMAGVQLFVMPYENGITIYRVVVRSGDHIRSASIMVPNVEDHTRLWPELSIYSGLLSDFAPYPMEQGRLREAMVIVGWLQ